MYENIAELNQKLEEYVGQINMALETRGFPDRLNYTRPNYMDMVKGHAS